MKKNIFFVTLFISCIVCVFSVSACKITAEITEGSDVSGFSEVEESIESIAYMDLETADEEMRKKILEARNKIIFSKSWVADGIEGGGADPDNNTVTVPQFYDIFPLDWDIPTNINN